MAMHYARLKNSPRQQVMLSILSDGQEHSTAEIQDTSKDCYETRVCAVNSVASELRMNGIHVRCRQVGRVFYYRLGK